MTLIQCACGEIVSDMFILLAVQQNEMSKTRQTEVTCILLYMSSASKRTNVWLHVNTEQNDFPVRKYASEGHHHTIIRNHSVCYRPIQSHLLETLFYYVTDSWSIQCELNKLDGLLLLSGCIPIGDSTQYLKFKLLSSCWTRPVETQICIF